VSLGIIASVVVFIALLTVLEASKTRSQTAVLAAVSDQRSWGAPSGGIVQRDEKFSQHSGSSALGFGACDWQSANANRKATRPATRLAAMSYRLQLQAI
jgi:hypothetical protein